jgi:hypothetical protein
MGQWALQRDTRAQGDTRAFDIPAQPLSSALDTYSAKTGFEVLYDSDLALHRRSPPLKGNYSARDALSALLSGSGLVARAISDGAITIMASPAQQAMPPAPAPEASPYRNYFAAIQASFEGILCQGAGVIPSNYRGVIRFGIGRSGDVEHPELLDSNGTSVEDVAVSRLFAHMAIGASPPSGLPQPVMLLVLPQSSTDLANCSALQ